MKMLKDDSLEPELLERLYAVHSEDDDVLERLAKHPNTTVELMQKLASDDHSYSVRVALAKRKDLPKSILAQLAYDSDSDVREAVAKRGELFDQPEEVIERALQHLDLDELGAILKHPKFPEWKLYELSDNCTPEDARKILRSPAVSKRVLRRLGSNPESRPFIKEHPVYQKIGWFEKLFFFAASGD